VLHEDRERAASFGLDAARYDRARPGYPAALVDHLVGAGPAHGVSVLDVGCGTGIAAAQLASRGCTVLGLEPDERMAEVARTRGLTVQDTTFEDFDPADRRFDVLTCAQAWHWIDPQRAPAQAARCLRPGGTVAIFWNIGLPPEPLRAAMEPVYRRLEPVLAAGSIVIGHEDERLDVTGAALTASGSFAAPQQRTWTHTRIYDTAQWREFLLSHSDHQTLPPARREALLDAIDAVLDAHGGRFEMTYATRAVIAVRR
jgi:SAM-dependent methyltransferase